MNTTIIFICIFYVVFSALFIYGKTTKDIKSAYEKILFAIFSILLGWIVFPIVLGEDIK